MTIQENTPIKCEFCGALRKPVICHLGTGSAVIGYMPCTCPDAQRILDEAAQAEVDEKRRKDAERSHRRLVKAGIPERYWKAETDRTDLIKAAKSQGLYIQGDVGTGKTHLACAIGIQLLNEGVNVLFVKASDLTDMMSQFADNIEAVNAIKAPDVLIIDDLGMGETRDWSDKRLRRAIDARWDSGKPVIITSNYSKQALNEYFSKSDVMNADAIVSRLFGMTKKIELAGTDRRLQQ